jgi:leader peptidase (prepilin peptidase)/N-methyltransferase
MFLMHLASPSALGFGDVKLGAVLGAALGLIDPRLGLVALCVAAAVTSVVGLARHRESLPLGPGLVLGATIAPVTFGVLDAGVVTWR